MERDSILMQFKWGGKVQCDTAWDVGLLGERYMHVFSIYATEKY